MTSLANALSNIYIGLTSERVNERKKNAESLKEYLAETGMPALLTENHRKNSGITWKNLFLRVHDLIIKEAEKFNTGRANTVHNIKTLCTSLIFNVIQGANKNKCYVPPDKVLECCTGILCSDRLLGAFGDTYMTIVSKYILRIQYYLNNLAPSMWEDLLKVSIELCNSSCIDDKLMVVKLMAQIMKEGIKRCHLVLVIRDNLAMLTNLYTSNDIERQHYMQENIIQIAIMIVENVAPESRLAVCVFTENSIPHVIKFYGQQNADALSNKKRLLFKFLYLSIIIHHPGGRSVNQSGALVKDRTVWRTALRSIQMIIKIEATSLTNILKRVNQHSQLEICTEFIKMAVEFYHQNFNGSLQESNTHQGDMNPPKRSRMEQNDCGTLRDLIHSASSNYYPWLSITAAYVLKYSNTISNTDKELMLEILCGLVISENSVHKSTVVYEVSNNICKELCDNGNSKKKSEVLTIIWNTCTRKVSTDSPVFDQCHSLIQSIMNIKEFDPPLESLLKLYSDKTMLSTFNSLHTLSVLLSHYNFNINDKNMLIQISQWVITNCWLATECHSDIPLVLFQLCVNETMHESQINTKYPDLAEQLFDSLEYIMLKSDFENGLLVENNTNLGKTAKNTVSWTVSEKVFEQILSYMKTFGNENRNSSNLVDIINRCCIVLRFVSLFRKYNVQIDSSALTTYSLDAHEKNSAIMTELPKNLYDLSGVSNDKIDLLQRLKILYQKNNYTSEMFETICANTTKEMVECLCTLVNDGMQENDLDIMEVDIKQFKETHTKLIVLDILINFCTVNSIFRDQILKFILDPQSYDFQSKEDFDICIHVLTFIIKEFSQEEVPIAYIVNLLQLMCKQLYQDDFAVYSILSLLYEILDIISKFGTAANRQNCIIMLSSFMKRCNSKYYHIKTMAQAFKCLSWVLNKSNVPGWTEQMYENLFQGLSNPIHSIRLYSCLCLGHSMKDASPRKFTQLIQELPNVFMLNAEDLTENVMTDESANRSSTVLHCLATVAVTSPIWDKKSLASIMEICCTKSISPILTKKVFQCISKHLNIKNVESLISDNIKFFVHFWFSRSHSLDMFPFYLVDCSTKENFILRFKSILVPAEMFWLGNGSTSILADFIAKKNSIPIENVLQECLSDAVALSLPYIGTQNMVEASWNLNDQQVKRGKNLFLTLCNILGEKNVTNMMKKQIVEIFKSILNNVCDKQSILGDLGWNGTLPFMEGPNLTNLSFKTILNYLNERFQSEILMDLCTQNPSGIQELLLHLWSNISLEHNQESKILRLHQYWTFCHFIPLHTELNTYICSFIIHSLLHLINEYKNKHGMDSLTVASCKMLHSMMKQMLPDTTNIVSKYLSLIVYTISQATLENVWIKESALALLVFLLVDMKSHLDTIQSLDPLPNVECFSELNTVLNNICLKKNDSLSKKIESFLNGGLIGRYEGLKVLHDKLKTSKTELHEIFEKLKECRGFSEDCKNSILHQLTCALIQIASNENDHESSIQACRCLGELGVLDYQTLVLRPPIELTYITNQNPIEYLSYAALDHLQTLVFYSNPQVARASAKALTSLLSFKEGILALAILKQQSETDFIKKLMIPFISTRKTYPATKAKINAEKFDELINCSNFWETTYYNGHPQWITSLIVTLLKSFLEPQCFLNSFIEICELNQPFAEKLLPSIFGLLFSIGDGDQTAMIQEKIQLFFNNYYLSTYNSQRNANHVLLQYEKRNDVEMNSACRSFANESVNCMLEVIQFVMVQKKHYTILSKSRNSQDTCTSLTFDFLPIAWAASSTNAHFTAIYYGELWCLSSTSLQLPSNPEKISSLDRGEQLLSILRKSYLSIGDSDALNGCGSAHLLDPAERRNFYMRNKSFSDALLMHDLALAHLQTSFNHSASNMDPTTSSNYSYSAASENRLMSERSFASSLQMSGLYHLANKYMEACSSDTLLDDMKYECFWRLGDWSLQVDSTYLGSRTLKDLKPLQSDRYWSANHYACLKDSVAKNLDIFVNNSLNEARHYVALNCMQNCLESCQCAYAASSKFQILQEIEHFIESKIKGTENSESLLDLMKSWSSKNLLSFSDFKHIEPILAQRVIILESLSIQNSKTEFKLSIPELQLQYAELALSHNWIQAAIRWIDSASRTVQNLFKGHADSTEDGSKLAHVSGLIRLAEGKAAWKSGHSDVALHLVKTLIVEEDNENNILYANALKLYGSWMVETRSENSIEILENYLNKSLTKLDKDDKQGRIDAYITIARFADGEYKQMNAYMKSASFVNKIKCMEQCENTANTLLGKPKEHLTRDERKALLFNKGQKTIDSMEIQNTETERDYYLELAIRCYFSSLSLGEDNNLCVFRIISLWLDNPLADAVQNDILFLGIPSRKFLPVLPQLAPRMSSKRDAAPYQHIINKIIERCLVEHPHHTLPVVLALKNSNKDMESSQSKNKSDAYIIAASEMLSSVAASSNSLIASIIKETEFLSQALIKFANTKVDSKLLEQVIPKSELLKQCKDLSHAMVPTVTVPVRKDGNYSDIPNVVSFCDKFQLVGGVNVPKKLYCQGSDGIKRPMLLKGEDDIRQDAVMQQVFVIVNHLLASNQHTRQRRLLIRTYKVVALSRRSGVIEWCEGTEPLGRLLVGANGNGGYHSQFRPRDISAKEARKLMDKNRAATSDKKLHIFKEILAKFKPVFHHFFFENFLLPSVWYERKLAYTHSVATSSMIGYILGLGDRHVQNILVDKITAEVIHIDLGIAFEQGRVQPTPETVPFRLTQDIVSGMGSAGVEGVFRRSCEKTMDVLRANQETLLTILEVLLCDPLYMWTISPQRAYSKQDLTVPSTLHANTESVGSGSEAERALLRVKNKLEGVEFGSVLATPGQVARLLQQATDDNNLSKLFPGWQPYL